MSATRPASTPHREKATGTVAGLWRTIAQGFTATSSSPTLDARIIVAHVIGAAPSDLALREDESVGAEAVVRAMVLAARRVAGEPVARIVGEKEFYGLAFGLSPDTLVPRPDTETVVEAVLAAVLAQAPVTVLDLGTGSGAILLALLAALPNARGLGVDVSAGAIATARANAERLGLSARATFAVGDWADGVAGRFDVITANPPYIETAAIAGLPVEVRDFDPHIALDGGADGLAAFRAVFADLDRVMANGGAAFVEVGAGQAHAVANIARAHRMVTVFRRDLAGILRVVIVRRRGDPAVTLD